MEQKNGWLGPAGGTTAALTPKIPCPCRELNTRRWTRNQLLH
jgi:hypothetical protein